MHTYCQTALNQSTVETPYYARQLMNSHYNITLLTEFEQVLDAMNSESQSSIDTHRTDTEQTEPKTLAAAEVSNPTTLADNSETNCKPSVTGHVPPLQRQHSGPVHGILAGYESDDSWDAVLNASYDTEENNIAFLTY